MALSLLLLSGDRFILRWYETPRQQSNQLGSTGTARGTSGSRQDLFTRQQLPHPSMRPKHRQTSSEKGNGSKWTCCMGHGQQHYVAVLLKETDTKDTHYQKTPNSTSHSSVCCSNQKLLHQNPAVHWGMHSPNQTMWWSARQRACQNLTQAIASL